MCFVVVLDMYLSSTWQPMNMYGNYPMNVNYEHTMNAYAETNYEHTLCKPMIPYDTYDAL